MRILVAERDYHQGRFISQMLTLAGHDVRMCDDPSDLLHGIDGSPPNVLLFDVLNASQADSGTQPVVIITSSAACKDLSAMLGQASPVNPDRSRLSSKDCNLAMENLLCLCHSMHHNHRIRSREVEIARRDEGLAD